MDNRFTLKDFLFVVLFLIVTAVVGFAMWQFSYQEGRINDVRDKIQSLDQTQKQQLVVLQEIRNALRSGVSVNGGSTTNPGSARIRQVNPDGSQYVYYPDVPQS